MENQENGKKRSWGGARAGAGRKGMDAGVKKVSVTFSLSPEHKALIQSAAKAAGVSASEFLASLLDGLNL